MMDPVGAERHGALQRPDPLLPRRLVEYVPSQQAHRDEALNPGHTPDLDVPAS
jgi:hypothetical protein